MNIKKIATAAFFAILPPLSIILTTPFLSLMKGGEKHNDEKTDNNMY